jgi:transposase
MELSANTVETQVLDHLGLVAATAAELGIAAKIDSRLAVSRGKGAVVTMGQRAVAMILNGLGFLNDRLYLVSHFFENKPVSRLLGPNVTAQHLNDDALGRCLDAIHAYGTTKLFSEIAFEIGLEQGLLGKSARLDTTSLSLTGDYEGEQSDGTPKITHGYSKDHRADLKQVVLSLTTTSAAGFPIWMEALDGNSSDKNNFHETLKKMTAFQKQLEQAPTFMFVADSALYTASKLLDAPHLQWITRVPETVSAAKELVETPFDSFAWQEIGNGYKVTNLGSIYGMLKQRWQMIYSEQAFIRENKTLIKKVASEHESLAKSLWHASNKIYTCESDANNAAKALSSVIKYHTIAHTIEPVLKYKHSGKPKTGELPDTVGYQIISKAEANAGLIAQKRSKLGRFILATNNLSYENLKDEELLKEYKELSKTEAGFRFIKDPCFQVSSVFLKTAERIEALTMIMTLCIMVYNVAQFKVREALKANEDTLPNQSGKQVQNPTIRWLFRLMNGVTVVRIAIDKSNNIFQEFVANITDDIRKIITYFGSHAMTIYGTS